MPSPWLLEAPTKKPGRCRLFCFPYAGGGASLFTAWNSLSPAAEVVAVQLPGRENRLREPPATRLEDIVPSLLEAIEPQLFGPWAVFGHSFGGLLAYETARAAVRDGHHQPEAVFVSACRPPDVESRFPKLLHTLSDEELIAALEDLGASPSPILSDPEMRRLVLPAVRADIELCETYEFVPDDVLEAPIVAFSGADDHHADPAEMKRWREFTHGSYNQRIVPGGHFFLKTDPALLVAQLKELLNAPTAKVR
jgi:medium-chain acyl-[acyl-carrier-protein] hydrolase